MMVRDFAHSVVKTPAQMAMPAIGSHRGEKTMKKKKTNPRRMPMSMADVKKTMREAMAKASRDLSIAAIVFAAMALHDEFDFGPQRLERFVLNVLRKFRDWDEGLFDIDDALEWFESYTGMRIQEIMEVDGQ